MATYRFEIYQRQNGLDLIEESETFDAPDDAAAKFHVRVWGPSFGWSRHGCKHKRLMRDKHVVADEALIVPRPTLGPFLARRARRLPSMRHFAVPPAGP